MNLVNTTSDIRMHMLPRDQKDEVLSWPPQAGRQEELRSLHVTTTLRSGNPSLFFGKVLTPILSAQHDSDAHVLRKSL